MGKEAIDVEQLKRDKKAKKEEARKISQQSKAKTQQMPPPIPLRRVMHAIPQRTTLAGAVGSFTLMTYNVWTFLFYLLGDARVCMKDVCVFIVDYRSLLNASSSDIFFLIPGICSSGSVSRVFIHFMQKRSG